MKKLQTTLSIALAIIFAGIPNIFSAQIFAHPHLTFQDLSGQHTPVERVITSGESTIVVFWNSGNPKHIEYLDALNDQILESKGTQGPQIIAVSTDKYHLPQKLRAVLAGKHWAFDVYVDVNQSFSRMYAVCDEQLQAYVFSGGKKSSVEIRKPELLPQDFLAEAVLAD